MFESLLKNLDILFILLLTLLCIPFILLCNINETPVRIILGYLLLVFLPGYSLITALFPRIDDLGGIERITLSFGTSIGFVTLIGLILYYSPLGIKLIPILITLSTFTVSLSFVALFRRLKLPAEERFSVPFERLKFNLGQSILDKGLSIILIAAIIGSSATLVYVLVTPETGERFTEFYILGPNGTASDYPTDLTSGEDGEVIIVIVNHEYENITYNLEVIFNGSLIHKEKVFLVEIEK